jgi:hypothetical protein
VADRLLTLGRVAAHTRSEQTGYVLPEGSVSGKETFLFLQSVGYQFVRLMRLLSASTNWHMFYQNAG